MTAYKLVKQYHQFGDHAMHKPVCQEIGSDRMAEKVGNDSDR